MEEDKISSINIDGKEYAINDAVTSKLLTDTIEAINKNNSTFVSRLNDMNDRLEELKTVGEIFSKGSPGQILVKTETGYEWQDVSFSSNKSQLTFTNQPTATVFKTGKISVKWDEVENADSYIVNTNKKELVDTNSYNVTNFGGDILIKAISNSNEICDSDYVIANKVYDESEPSAFYNLYDILWSDGEVTQEIRPVADGVVPVAICVIPTNWLDENENARFVSLKYVTSDNISGSSYKSDHLCWGSYNPEPDPVKDYYIQYACKSQQSGTDSTTAHYYWNSTRYDEIPDLRDHDSWTQVYKEHKEHIADYALTDINGRLNTSYINVPGNIEAELDLKTYLTSFTVSGVDSGEWYLPAAGEIIHFTFNMKFGLNDIVKEIHDIYPSDCVEGYEITRYWSSTVNNEFNAYCSEISEDYVNIMSYRRDYTSCVVAFLEK